MLIAPTWLQIRTSDLRNTFPETVRTWPFKIFSIKGRTKGNVPLIFLGLNANCSNAVKVTVFKSDNHVPRDTPDMTPLKFSEKRAWPGTHDPLNFGVLNANCWNMVIDMDFKFDKHFPCDSPDMTFKNFFKKGCTKGNVPPYIFGR